MTVRRWLFALAGAAALLLPLGMTMRAATTHQVEIVDFAFTPATLTISVGDTVTWTNGDAVEHTATGSGFDSGLLGQGESYSVTFSEAGTYDYLCTPHPTMTGQIIVQAAAAPAASPGTVPNVAMHPPEAPPAGWLPVAVWGVVGVVGLWLICHARGTARYAAGGRR